MSVNKRDLRVIEHIYGYCLEIDEACERFGREYEIFAQDKIYRNACVMCIIQIGELVGHLTDEFKSAHDGMPWKAIRGMRNIAAHAYGSMNIPATWKTIVERIPELRDYCRTLMDAHTQE